jgi:hypothetical protein
MSINKKAAVDTPSNRDTPVQPMSHSSLILFLRRLPALLASAIIVSACSSSGGGQNPTPPPANSGTLQFSSESFQAHEGTVAALTVTRSGGNTGSASITCATVSGGTATASSDYNSTSTILSWTDGESGDKTCHVTLNTDGIVDPAETVNLALSNASGAALGTPSTAVLTISDNDSPGTLQFVSATYTVNEAKGTAAISVSRTGGNAGTVTVNYSTSDGTALSGSDYTATSGTLTWTDGDIGNKSFSIPLVADAVTEGNETIQMALATPGGGATLGSIVNAALTISDNPGTLRFSLADYTISEDGGSITVNVARVGGSNGPAAAQLKIAQPAAGSGELPARGPATPGVDYSVPPTDLLIWPDGDGTPKSYTIPIINNSGIEGEEIIQLALCESSGAPTGSVPVTTITIVEPVDEIPADGVLSNLLDNATGPVPFNIPIDVTFTELLSPTGYNQDSITVSFRPTYITDVSCDPVIDTALSPAGTHSCSQDNTNWFTCQYPGTPSGDLDCRVPGSIAYDAATLTLSFVPTHVVPPIDATITIAVGSVLDQDGHASTPNTLTTLTTSSSNSVVDTQPPSLATRAPGIGAAVPVNAPIYIVLNDFMMNTTTLNTNNYRLSYDNDGTKQYVAGTISFTEATNGVAEEDMTVTFHPACPLRPATVYTVELTDGIRDFARNKLTPTTWTFTTQP